MNNKDRVTLLEMENNSAENIVLKYKLNLKNVSSVRTPFFGPLKEVGTKLYFDVDHRYIEISPRKRNLSVILRKYSQSPIHSNLNFEYSFSVLYSDGSTCVSSKTTDPIDLWKFEEMICSNRVFDLNTGVYVSQHERQTYDGILILQFRVTFFCNMALPISHNKNIDTLQILTKFTKNFGALYLSNELCDVSIQIGENTFMSHKFVLSAHSPVFKRMLMLDFQEAETGVIAISDVEPEVFGHFLKFLYTGEVEDKTISNFKQLYVLADKYDVEILKQECYNILTDLTLNEDEIDDLLEIAYRYNDDLLKKAAKTLLVSTTIKK